MINPTTPPLNLSDRPLLLLKSLKGAPVSCLTAMLLHAVPVTVVWLTQATGYHPTSVARALRILQAYDLVLLERQGKYIVDHSIHYASAEQLTRYLACSHSPSFTVPSTRRRPTARESSLSESPNSHNKVQ